MHEVQRAMIPSFVDVDHLFLASDGDGIPAGIIDVKLSCSSELRSEERLIFSNAALYASEGSWFAEYQVLHTGFATLREVCQTRVMRLAWIHGPRSSQL